MDLLLSFPIHTSCLLLISQVSNILSKYAPFSEWKFDVYLTDLTRGLHLNTFLDRFVGLSLGTRVTADDSQFSFFDNHLSVFYLLWKIGENT